MQEMRNAPLILLIFMGMQFVSLGLLGEMQAGTCHESRHKPIYTIRKVLGRRRLDGDR